MNNFDAEVRGANGCELQIGVGVYTPSGRHAGKKIIAIGIAADAVIASFTIKDSEGNEIVINGDNWFGQILTAGGVNTYIPFGENAIKVSVTSGSVWMYFKVDG
jgi:hypothetical protein